MLVAESISAKPGPNTTWRVRGGSVCNHRPVSLTARANLLFQNEAVNG